VFVGVVGQAHPSWAHLLTGGGVGEFVIRLSLSSVEHFKTIPDIRQISVKENELPASR